MNQAPTVFDYKLFLPDERLSARQKTMLGFDARYNRVQSHLQLLLNMNAVAAWSIKHHGRELPLCALVSDQYPLVLFHGDVGTGKTATAECIANRLVADARVEDSILFKLSNRVRGSGKVGEMGTQLAEAFQEVVKSAGQGRRAILIIDEADSLAAARSQEHSHHEDKVAVNTLIQCIDDLRRFSGRIAVFLCTNRASVIDAALLRRAAIIEEFLRPNDIERFTLLSQDLQGVGLDEPKVKALVAATGARSGRPGWTYSDIRTRLYPTALAKAFPHEPLGYVHLAAAAAELLPSPVMEDI